MGRKAKTYSGKNIKKTEPLTFSRKSPMLKRAEQLPEKWEPPFKVVAGKTSQEILENNQENLSYWLLLQAFQGNERLQVLLAQKLFNQIGGLESEANKRAFKELVNLNKKELAALALGDDDMQVRQVDGVIVVDELEPEQNFVRKACRKAKNPADGRLKENRGKRSIKENMAITGNANGIANNQPIDKDAVPEGLIVDKFSIKEVKKTGELGRPTKRGEV